MNKALLGIVAVIIIAVGAWLIIKGAPGGGSSYAPAGTGAPASGPVALSALVAAGNPVTCTFSTTTAQGTEEGTIYVADGKVAGDFTMNGTQGPTQAHMIMQDQTNYFWTSAGTQGFKSAVTATSSSGSSQQGVSYSEPADYACQPWTADESKFTLPANITFMDMSAMTHGAAPAAPGGATSVQGTQGQCAACGELSGTQKAACLAALHCAQ